MKKQKSKENQIQIQIQPPIHLLSAIFIISQTLISHLLTDMIRRKNQTNAFLSRPASIDRSNIRHHSKDHRNSKYNYPINSIHECDQSRIQRELSRLSRRSREDADRSRQIIEEERSRERVGCQGVLRKGQLYEDMDLEFKYGGFEGKDKVSIEKKLNRTFNESQIIDIPLKDTTLVYNNIQSALGPNSYKTIRKSDNFHLHNYPCPREAQLSGTNRQNLPLQERQPTTESQLDAKYEQIWQSNQLQKQRSFSCNNSENITLRNVEQQNTVIVNTRANMLKSRQQNTEEGDRKTENARKLGYCENSLSQITARREGRLMQQRKSVDLGGADRSSSIVSRSRRLDCPLHQSIPISIPPQLRCTIPPPPLAAHYASIQRQETDLRLRMIQDFSSKISIRILQLTTTLDEMCSKKR